MNFALNPDEAIAHGATLRATQIYQKGVTNIILNESNAKWLKNKSSTHTIDPLESIVSAIKVREVRIPKICLLAYRGQT